MRKTKQEVKESKVEAVISSFKSQKERLYPTDNLKEYERIIQRWNMVELQDHAISLGFKPSHNRQILEKTLINQFNKRFGANFEQEQVKTISKEKQKKIDSVLQSWK